MHNTDLSHIHISWPDLQNCIELVLESYWFWVKIKVPPYKEQVMRVSYITANQATCIQLYLSIHFNFMKCSNCNFKAFISALASRDHKEFPCFELASILEV